MADFDRRAASLDRIIPADARIECVASGFGFTEGPVWDGDGLLFSDIPNSRIVRWRELPEGPIVSTHRYPSNLSNGLTLDAQRRLLACEGAARRVSRTDADGRVVSLAERYEGKRLNSPNDVVAGPDGSAYFSDPWWAHRFPNPAGPRVPNDGQELEFAGVYRVDADGALQLLVDDFAFPNGLAFSPDGRTLNVDDTRRHHIRAFDVGADGRLSNGRVFADLRADEEGVPDGMKVDIEGNVYCTGAGGVWVVAPNGEVLGRIMPPEVPANVAWGGEDWRTLYMTARGGLYRVRLSIPGVPVPA